MAQLEHRARRSRRRDLLRASLAGALGGAGERLCDSTPTELERWQAVSRGLVHRVRPGERTLSSSSGASSSSSRSTLPRYADAHRPDGRRARAGAHAPLAGHQTGGRGDAAAAALGSHSRRRRGRRTSASTSRAAGHGSSLSPAIHCARRRATRRCRVWRSATSIRRRRSTSTTPWATPPRGVHIATLGGLWQAAVFGFGGISPTATGLRCDPHLPAAWRALCFPIEWRGRRVRFALRQAPLTLTARLEQGRSLLIEVGGLRHELHAGRAWACRLSQDELRWQEVNP